MIVIQNQNTCNFVDNHKKCLNLKKKTDKQIPVEFYPQDYGKLSILFF